MCEVCSVKFAVMCKIKSYTSTYYITYVHTYVRYTKTIAALQLSLYKNFVITIFPIFVQ